MSESEEDNENFCFFGKPLDPYDEDTIPKKRPITVEEQIATDAQGRRRFHGAFTGGFSAGFFNTVGSLEGWTPSEFKSSRSEKSKAVTQRPQDFMDDEDLGEDGIAPQVVRATDDYNTSRKRKKQVFNEGPIPGEPVLHNILTSGNETVGYMLLKNLRIKDHRKQKKEVAPEKTYGCEMPDRSDDLNIELEGDQYQIPDLYKEFLAKPKDNTYGLGYTGLDKGQFSLFPMETKSRLVVTDRNNKKLSISGQAFGVGAFEDDDDDIYMKEDMSRYDFELASEKEKEKPRKNHTKVLYDLFVASKDSPILKSQLKYPPPKIPHSFTGKHKVRRSRFEPLVHKEEKEEEEVAPSNSRINPMIRARYLGEEAEKEFTPSKSLKEIKIKQEEKEKDAPVEEISYLTDRFVSSSKKDDVSNILEPVEKSEAIHGTEEMRGAARMKMFGPLTRISCDWAPSALLCKRFNVPEPFVDQPQKTRTRTKNILFEYQKHVEEVNLQPGLNKEEPQVTEAKTEEKEKEEEDKEEEPPVGEIKTEPEENQPKDITDRIDLEQKQDLFRAVFLSSDSEEEEEEEKAPEECRREELKSAILSDQLIPKIRPLKEGVLSGINFHKFSKPVENSTEKKPDEGCYGPKLPEKIEAKANVSVISSESEDEWVERDGDVKKKKNKHKKEKKHKKHKKHKHEKKIVR